MNHFKFVFPALKTLSLSRLGLRHTHKKVGENSYRNLGVEYEKKVQTVLSNLFKVPVDHVGGSRDGGIDLKWSWSKDSHFNTTNPDNTAHHGHGQLDHNQNPNIIDFVVQCKLKTSRGVGPDVGRELIGVLSNENSDSVGCLCTNYLPTKDTLQAFKVSDKPLIIFILVPIGDTIFIKLIKTNDAFQRLYPYISSVRIGNPTGPFHYTYTLVFTK